MLKFANKPRVYFPYQLNGNANGYLTTTDLSTVNYPAGTGCIALYELNGNANDTSNTYNGGAVDVTYDDGAFDQAAVFNGSTSYINTGNVFSNNVSTDKIRTLRVGLNARKSLKNKF